MTWKAPADPIQFDEAYAWFRKRVKLTREQADRLDAEQRRRAFWVSNAAQLDVVHHAWKAIDDALKKGTTLEDFKKEVGPQLRAAWGGSVKNPAWRLETIFRTNVQNAYGAGRWKQATDPDVLDDRPVWQFDAILDGRESSICHNCDATKLPADHAWWKTHTPPLHHNCRSGFITLSEEQAGTLTKTPPASAADAGFGLPPREDDGEAPEWYSDKLVAAPGPLAQIAGGGGGSSRTPPPPPSGGGGGDDDDEPKPPWHTDGKKRKPGELDESERKFSAKERRIADVLVADGNDVASRSEKPAKVGRGKRFDAFVNGIATEFKTAEVPAGLRRQVLKSISNGVAQAPNVVVDVRKVTLTAEQVDDIMGRIPAELGGLLDHVRVIGHNFDRTYSDLKKP